MPHQTYIAFLRAINVGGHNVTMERLRALFSELELANVRTFIQTGNVFFETEETDRAGLTAKIEAHLAEALGYAVPACLRTLEEVRAAVERNPFTGVEMTPETRLAILFLSAPLPDGESLPIRPMNKDEFEIIDLTPGEAFVVSRHANGKVPNPAAFIEKRYGVKATGRFYATTERILEAASAVTAPRS